jgi:signal transduction histidine kinase
MKFLISNKITIGFIVAFAALLFLAALSVRNTRRFLESSDIIARQTAVLYHAEQVKSIHVDIETGQRGFMVTGDSVFLEPYFNGVEIVAKNIEDLDSLLDNTQRNKMLISRLRDLSREKNTFAKKAIVERNNRVDGREKIVHSQRGKIIMDSIRAITFDIQDGARKIVAFQSDQRLGSVKSFNVTLIFALITVVALLGTLFILLNRKISQHVKAEERVNGLNKELEAFSYSVSHDLRSPLRIIDGYAMILKEDYFDRFEEEGKNAINVIIGNVRRMGQLIDDLLDFSHMSRKQLTPSYVDFSGMIERIFNEQRERYATGKIDFMVHNMNPVFADMKMMEQVWVNLISNAIKYSSKRELAKIEVGYQSNNGESWYYVRDNGVGFSMEYKEKLFGVFQRLHRMEDFPGTGVGLAIVKRIVMRHGGKVWAESSVNEGATFYFSLPKDDQKK